MKKLVTIIIAMAAAMPFMHGTSYALTAAEIIDRAEKSVRGDTLISMMEITIKNRRWTRTMKMKSWDNRVAKKSFAEILAPKKDAGNRFLMITAEKLMWHYNPDIGKEMKIHPSMMLQSWMGSDFTNDDIVKESSILDDYTHTLSGKKQVEGHECYVITMIPKPNAAVVWGKLIYYARVSDCLPVKQEFYDQHGKLKKVMTCSNFREMGGRVIPATMRMKTLKKKRQEGETGEEYTQMDLKDVKFNVKIPGNVFSLQNLKRR
ncbi:MAG: outer membrane lipoprotein-sorting protein [Spirochaetes bacterium]|nr:outer membrane lipoprotein-sorting protein [Spirochaetota bacterium]